MPRARIDISWTTGDEASEAAGRQLVIGHCDSLMKQLDPAVRNASIDVTLDSVAAPEQVVATIIRQLLKEHPLPWRIDPDWAQSVKAIDGVQVYECLSQEEADYVIETAECIQAELDDGPKYELLDACLEELPGEVYDQLELLPLGEIWDPAVEALREHGIEDPEAYLNERGLVRPE